MGHRPSRGRPDVPFWGGGVGEDLPVDIGYYEEIQGQLRALLIRMDDRLPPADLGLISEFIDHNELGVALEQIVAVLAELSASIGADERADLVRLAARMGIGREVEPDLARCPART